MAVHLIYCSNITRSAADRHSTFALTFTKPILRCNSRMSSRLYLQTTWVSQTPTLYAMQCALSISDSDHSLCCALIPNDALIPNNAESLKLCTQSFQQQIKKSSLRSFVEAPTTCTATYHLFTTGWMPCMHTLKRSDPLSALRRSKSYMHAVRTYVRPITHVRTDLIFCVGAVRAVYGTQEPICNCSEDFLFYHVHSQAPRAVNYTPSIYFKTPTYI